MKTYITYENSIGRLDFYGGGSKGLRIISIDGLGMPSKTFETVAYANQVGQETLSSKDNARIINIKFELVSSGNAVRDTANIIKILYVPGKLTIYNNSRVRQTECYCSEFEEVDNYDKIRTFVAQLTCDNTYFTDGRQEKVAVAFESKLLATTFSLPTMFSYSKAEADIVNHGEVETEPKFIIYNISQQDIVNQTIYIYNDTTGQRIAFVASLSMDSRITVDIPERKITLDDIDITAAITTDTFLSDFHLQPGTNHLRADTEDSSDCIGVDCVYSNRYIEAVI